MNKEQFKKFILNKESGIVVFYSGYCDVCSKYIDILDKKSITYFDVCCDDDVSFYFKEHNIDLIPVTRIYEFGKVVWEKLDILSPEDVEYVGNYKLP